jgi:hypothetical protein
MSGAIPPLPQYAFMAWCLVKAQGLLYLYKMEEEQEIGEDCIMSSFITCTSIIMVIKSRRVRWAGHVARMGQPRNAFSILVGKREGRK